MRYDRIAPLFFEKNRNRFLEALPKGCIAVIFAQSTVFRTQDVPYPFRQNSAFFYLCGCEDPDLIYVVINTEEGSAKQALFVKSKNTFDQIWHGYLKDEKHFQGWTGIETVLLHSDFENFISSNYREGFSLYSNLEEPSLRFSKNLRPRVDFIQALFKDSVSLSISSVLSPLRMRKSPLEEALIKRAIRITAESYKELLGQIREGQKEYELEAILSSAFLGRQASGFSFPPIIAAGINSCYLHHEAGPTALKNGDVLLMDIGAEYANYAADICRVVPVSGQFTTRQAEVYKAVHSVLNASIDLLRPGLFWTEYEHVVGELMSQALIQLGLLKGKDLEEQDPMYPAYKRYFMHGISHHIGLDVHDPSDRFVALEKGNIITVEPGIYIPEENLGIRLEQMVAIRENGAEVLSADIPIELEDIEALMKRS